MSVLQQGSDEWKAKRRECITSSDASVLMEVHPRGKTALQLYNDKKNGEETLINSAMQRGMDLEDDARDWYTVERAMTFCPQVIFSKTNPCFMSSLDGISADGKEIIEIKCPGEKNHALISSGNIPKYYYSQCQWHLLVTGFTSITLISYDGFDGVWKEIKRDEEYISLLQERAEEFLEYLQSDIPPPCSEKEFINVEADKCAMEKIGRWLTISSQLKTLKQEEDLLKDMICSMGDDGNFTINFEGKPIVRAVRKNRTGAVDWEKLCKELEIKQEIIEKYRKESIGFYQLKAV